MVGDATIPANSIPPMDDASGSSDTGVPAKGIVSVKTAAVLTPEYRLAAIHDVATKMDFAMFNFLFIVLSACYSER
jgi:hypothetical protein